MAVKGIKKDEDYESDKLQRKIEKVPTKSHRDWTEEKGTEMRRKLNFLKKIKEESSNEKM